MSVAKLFEPLALAHGPTMKNRCMLAPLTNEQSHPDGRLSEDEFRWLTMRAEGGFAVTMTCAMHVQAAGQGFSGQLGIFGDQHLEGLARLASAIKARGSIAAAQLYHAGKRAPRHLVGASVCPSDDEKTGARALTVAEVGKLRDDFIAAAKRAEQAGFDGVELHGANGYLLEQFIRPNSNLRTDGYGGTIENRARFVLEVVDAVIAAIGKDRVGIRLSPFGVFNDMPLYPEMEADYTYLARKLNAAGLVYIHLVDHSAAGAPTVPASVKAMFRTTFNRSLILSGGYDAARAESDLAAGRGDLIAVGKPFLANPDLIARWKANARVNAPDMSTFYTPGPKGYTDYPALTE
jgi:N-ethylmaleimide reductase